VRVAALVLDRLVAVEAGDDADRYRLLEFERFATAIAHWTGVEPELSPNSNRRRQFGVVVDLDESQVDRRVRGVDMTRYVVAVRETRP